MLCFCANGIIFNDSDLFIVMGKFVDDMCRFNVNVSSFVFDRSPIVFFRYVFSLEAFRLFLSRTFPSFLSLVYVQHFFLRVLFSLFLDFSLDLVFFFSYNSSMYMHLLMVFFLPRLGTGEYLTLTI